MKNIVESIQDVPCVPCQMGYSLDRHRCENPEFCRCDRAERHINAVQPVPEKKRWSYDCKGRLLTIREGLTVVPYEQTRRGWYAVVVEATSETDQQSYPRGGYNIVVTDRDVEAAVERQMATEEIITTRPEADELPSGTVVRSNAGTIACKYNSTLGVVFGNSNPFNWSDLELPLTVLHRDLS